MKALEMQQPGSMFPVMPSFPPTNITTEQIQKYLDENKKLILAILDNQNLGKLAECAQYQALLQKNLMYLAAIADAQPQSPALPPQMSPHPVMQQGGYYMQHPQAAVMAPQPGLFPQRLPSFSNQSPIQDPHQQLPIQSQMAMWPGGAANGMPHQTHTHHEVGSSSIIPPTSNSGLNNKQDKTDGGGGGGGAARSDGGADGDEPK